MQFIQTERRQYVRMMRSGTQKYAIIIIIIVICFGGGRCWLKNIAEMLQSHV